MSKAQAVKELSELVSANPLLGISELEPVKRSADVRFIYNKRPGVGNVYDLLTEVKRILSTV